MSQTATELRIKRMEAGYDAMRNLAIAYESRIAELEMVQAHKASSDTTAKISERAILLAELHKCQDEANDEVERLNTLYQAHTISANAALDKLRTAIDRRDALKLCGTFLSVRK